MDELWLIGRILICALFIGSGIGQLVDVEGSTRYATDKGMVLIVTLIPLTFLMHQFWAERNPRRSRPRCRCS